MGGRGLSSSSNIPTKQNFSLNGRHASFLGRYTLRRDHIGHCAGRILGHNEFPLANDECMTPMEVSKECTRLGDRGFAVYVEVHRGHRRYDSVHHSRRQEG